MTSLRNSKVIKKISFLSSDGDERLIVVASEKGTFRLPVSYTVEGRLKTEYRDLTAREVIVHEFVKNRDPVLTLITGEKVRVYTGADSSYLPAMVDGILSKHDRSETLRRKLKKRKEEMQRKKAKTIEITDEYDSPWWNDEDYT